VKVYVSASPANNPYSPFYPSRDNFFGREEIIESFLARLTPGERESREARHMLVVGDGGIGKTSLLLQFEASMGDSVDGHCVSVDCGDFVYDLSHLLTEISSQLPREVSRVSEKPTGLLNRMSQAIQDSDLTIGLSFPPSVSVEISPAKLLGHLDREHGLVKQCATLGDCILRLAPELDRPLVILLDQLGKVCEAPGGPILTRLLFEIAKDSVDHSNLLVVVAIRPERKGKLEHWFQEELFHPDLFARTPLYPLRASAARQLIRQPAAERGIRIDPLLVDAILERAGTHPYFLQLACFRLWEHLVSNERLERGYVTVHEDDIEQLVQDCHRGIFEDFKPEEQFLLRLLALAWPAPLTAMQIKEKTVAVGKIQVVDVDDVLGSLMAHRHRPMRFSERRSAFSIAHDLFAQYIREHECGEEQVELAVLQQLVDSAPQQYEVTGAILTHRELDKLWQYREALRLESRAIAVIVTSELNQSAGNLRWTRFLIGSARPDVRYAVARALSRMNDEIGRLLLTKLANDQDPRTREMARQALRWTQTEWTWDDEWNHELSGI
jgi:hypothetical protein